MWEGLEAAVAAVAAVHTLNLFLQCRLEKRAVLAAAEIHCVRVVREEMLMAVKRKMEKEQPPDLSPSRSRLDGGLIV